MQVIRIMFPGPNFRSAQLRDRTRQGWYPGKPRARLTVVGGHRDSMPANDTRRPETPYLIACIGSALQGSSRAVGGFSGVRWSEARKDRCACRCSGDPAQGLGPGPQRTIVIGEAGSAPNNGSTRQWSNGSGGRQAPTRKSRGWSPRTERRYGPDEYPDRYDGLK